MQHGELVCIRPRRRRRRRPRCRRRGGFALIETLIAIVILAGAGAGLVSLLTQTLATVHDLHARERETVAASRALAAASSLSGAQLAARVGVTRESAVWLDVARVTESLFVVVVRDTLHRTELLRTTIYRPSIDTIP